MAVPRAGEGQPFERRDADGMALDGGRDGPGTWNSVKMVGSGTAEGSPRAPSRPRAFVSQSWTTDLSWGRGRGLRPRASHRPQGPSRAALSHEKSRARRLPQFGKLRSPARVGCQATIPRAIASTSSGPRGTRTRRRSPAAPTSRRSGPGRRMAIASKNGSRILRRASGRGTHRRPRRARADPPTARSRSGTPGIPASWAASWLPRGFGSRHGPGENEGVGQRPLPPRITPERPNDLRSSCGASRRRERAVGPRQPVLGDDPVALLAGNARVV